MRGSRTFVLLLGLIVAFALGAAFAEKSPKALAGGARAPIALGSPAADVIAVDGHPAKINFDDNGTQTWFYADEEGVINVRYAINQGLVVKIVPRRTK